MAKIGLPVTIFGTSLPRLRVADDLVILRVLELERLAESGARQRGHFGRQFAVADRAARTPRCIHAARRGGAFRFRHVPRLRGGGDRTCARPAAPTWRMGIQLIGRRGAAAGDLGDVFVSSKSACSILTVFQSTSSSSAISMGSMVLMPWPDFGILGHDGHRAIGGDADIVVRIGRSRRGLAAALRLRASGSEYRPSITPPPASALTSERNGDSISAVSSAFHRRPPYSWFPRAPAALLGRMRRVAIPRPCESPARMRR